MSVHWNEILLAFLHDPPDKALAVRGHVSRARDNAQVALGDDAVSRKRVEDTVSDVDPMAAVVERLPMPTAGESGERAVGPKKGRLSVIHPLSARAVELHVPDSPEGFTNAQREQLRRIVQGLDRGSADHARNRFLAVWRLWPDLLAENVDPCFAQLPADTRTPDHTIWNHLDVTAALKAAEAERGGAALLAFVLGPVQRFIEAARSVRDLWSGSMILSWLAFRAIVPVIESLGPTALVYPALRGNPLVDLWLRDHQRLGAKVPLPEIQRRLTPSLPHRFLAVVPWGDRGSAAKQLAAACERALIEAWKQMARTVRQELKSRLDSLYPDWDKRWEAQIESYFAVSTAIVPLAATGEEVDQVLARLLAGSGPFAAAFKDAEAVRGMARAIPQSHSPAYPQDHAGRWQYQVELVSRSLASQRAIRHIPRMPPSADSSQRSPQKCTLLASFEQMGPEDLAGSKRFWNELADSQRGLSIHGVRLRNGEALCAVALVKRFAGPVFLAKQLNVEAENLRFPDTWTVAAAEWLENAGIDWKAEWRNQAGERVPWNGQWLHWSRPDQDLEDAEACPAGLWDKIEDARRPEKCGSPPVYYAILKLDGDELGSWLRGEKSPKVREVIHPDLVRYYEGLGDAAKAGLEAKRPVGPALHAAISTALANFGQLAVPEIVRRFYGTTVYSGGDDTLVLLPLVTALECALQLRQTYMTDWWRPTGDCLQAQKPRDYLMMGSRATLSGGLVLVHAKDDLRLALQDARHAEKRAKEAGKDILAITIRRRSGEHTSALCPWEFVSEVENWRKTFGNGASDRWVYRLYAERTTLGRLPPEAIRAELKRQVARSTAPTPSLMPPESVADAFDRLLASCVKTGGGSTRRFPDTYEALEAFLTLCHTASFLARGRD
jgi:CRISPR-associated protein Cmr2